ncbi:MAG: CinA family protein [Rhodospirillales bacterium]|jgi:nicotinamide-nucleotide amidase
MDPELLRLANIAAEHLRNRNETVAVAESSAGGLIASALLAVPGASRYFLGGAVVYTLQARQGLVGITQKEMDEAGIRSSSEPYAIRLANRIRDIHSSSWGLAETGAAGPTGNRYGDLAGHSCIAVSGPINNAMTLETGDNNRADNMIRFAGNALAQLVDALQTATGP